MAIPRGVRLAEEAGVDLTIRTSISTNNIFVITLFPVLDNAIETAFLTSLHVIIAIPRTTPAGLKLTIVATIIRILIRVVTLLRTATNAVPTDPIALRQKHIRILRLAKPAWFYLAVLGAAVAVGQISVVTGLVFVPVFVRQ